MSKIVGFVYITTCLANDKIYVGQHSVKSGNWKYIGSGNLLRRAIKKFGRKEFKRKILRICYSQKEMNFWERFYIKEYNSTNKEIGYNIAEGDVLNGEINPAKLPEVRKKMSESHIRYYSKSEENRMKYGMKGEKHPLYGKKHSEKTKNKMSNSRKGKCVGEEHPYYGKSSPFKDRKHSEETKKKMSEKAKLRWKKVHQEKDKDYSDML